MSFAAAFDPAAFAAAVLDPDLPLPEGLLVWNGSDPTPRLAVYRNNVASSLIDALADTYPVVQELVGEAFFRAMASRFVRQTPPQTRLLAFYGEEFADFVAGFEPARSVPYLADMARLEMARVWAYHAADAAPATAAALSQALGSGERAGELRMSFRPGLGLVCSDYAVVSLWAAHQGLGEIGSVDPMKAESALVLRQGLEVIVLRLPPGVAAFVGAAVRGLALGEAAAAALAEQAHFDLQGALGLLLQHGALASLQPTPSQDS